MGGVGPGRREKAAEAELMRSGARNWIRRAGQDLRGISGPALLSALCAAAFCPLIAIGVTGAAAIAGIGVLSSVGSGVLTDVIIKAIGRLRGADAEDQVKIEKALADEISRVLTAGAADAAALRADIGLVLGEIDVGGAMLREAIESGNDQLRGDVIEAIGVLGSEFAELGFLIKNTAARILQELDGQRAMDRVLMEENLGQSAAIRQILEGQAVIEQRLAPATGSDDSRAAPGPRWEGCPYRGLLPFGEADADIFYGRERATTELAIMVAGQASRGGLVIVSGASGAGKSSLLRAGLLPALARGLQVSGSARWPRLVMTPTKEPMTELAAHLAALGGTDARTLRDTLREDPEQARLAARQVVLASAARDQARPAPGDPRLVLIVDQFEQVFTLDPDGDADRQRFIAALHAMTTNPDGAVGDPPAVVVLAVRGDFLDRCSAFDDLAAAVRDNQLFLVQPMSDSELRLAITGPADAAGLQLAPGLTNTVLDDLRVAGIDNVTGLLPLLSQAMLLTWDNRDGNRLTLHGYGQSGGISRAVETSADAAYDSLPAAGQVLAREILLTMTIASRAKLARRPVTRADLNRLPDAEPARADEVVERFAARRLIVLNDGTAEIAHDALLTAWPRLRAWLADDQASLILHSQLADDAEAWSRDRVPDFLYRGTRLAGVQRAAETWQADRERYPALTDTENDFLRASLRADRRRIRRNWTAVVALLILLAASLTGAGLATASTKNADYQRDLAASDQLAAESEQLDPTDLVTAAQLAAAAWKVLPTPAARASLLDVLARGEIATLHPGVSVNSVAISPDGKVLATAEVDGTARLWDVVTHREIGKPLYSFSGPAINGALAVAFSPNGRILATGDGYGTAQLWDVATHRQIGAAMRAVPFENNSTTGVYGVAFSPDGQVLATAGGDGTLRLWDVATQRQIGAPIIAVPGNGGGLSEGLAGVAFSPDGQVLATAGGDGTVRLWDMATHRQIGAPIVVSSLTRTDSGGAYAVSFSPDGRVLATAAGDGTVRLWNAVTHQAMGAPIIAVSEPGSNTANTVVFSPDGSMLATAGSDGTVRLWNATTHQEIGVPLIAARDGGVNSVVFSSDGDILATAGSDGTARLWNPAFYAQVGDSISAAMDSNFETANDATFSPDGSILATAGSDGTARLWNVSTHQEIGAPLTGAAGLAFTAPTTFDVAFSPDGRILASAAGGITVRLWDVATHQEIGAPIPPLPLRI